MEDQTVPAVKTDIRKRRGRFRASCILLETLDVDKVHALFDRMIILEATRSWDQDCVEYLAWSDLFDVCGEGEMAPLYEIEASWTGDSGLRFSAKRLARDDISSPLRNL